MAKYFREPYKHLLCECGDEVSVEMSDQGHGYDCSCGRIYNGVGQLLASRSQWEDRYDEDSSGRYCDEFGYRADDEEYNRAERRKRDSGQAMYSRGKNLGYRGRSRYQHY